jgi:hypothetical protein
MAITTLLKENWKEEKEALQKSILLLKKEVAEYKKERKSSWKIFKTKFQKELTNVEKSLNKWKGPKNKKAIPKPG